jgi:hypothetical protein
LLCPWRLERYAMGQLGGGDFLAGLVSRPRLALQVLCSNVFHVSLTLVPSKHRYTYTYIYTGRPNVNGKAARVLTHRRRSMRVHDLSATRLRLPKFFDTGHEELPGRRLPLFARAIAGDRRGHVPAHALPSAEHPKVKKTPNSRKPKRHAAHDRVRTEEALGARRALLKMRQWLVRVNQAPQIPEFADMLVIRESVWQRGARTARSPVFGVAAVEYLICALVVVGAAAYPSHADGSAAKYPPPAEGSTAHIVGINTRTAPIVVSGSTSSSRRAEEPDGDAPKVHIDPQSFAALEKALSDLDKPAHHDQLKYRQQGVSEAPPRVDQPDAPASVPETSAIAPPPSDGPPPVAKPNGQTADAVSQQPPGPR